jgi:endonuclease/exonuclease/phosphatase family metal-dependent hydrolase
VVVNLAGEVVSNAPSPAGGGGPSHLTFSLRDGNGEDIFCLFPRVCAAVEAARAAGGVALLHCWQGVSRSASCAIAYLMWAGGCPYLDAYDFVRARRPIVSPNAGFTCQLVEWGAFLGGVFARGRPRPRPGPLLLRLRRLADGCSAEGALLGVPGDAGAAPVAHALTVCRREEDRALLRAGAATAASQAPLSPGEALLCAAWDARGDGARVTLLLPAGDAHAALLRETPPGATLLAAADGALGAWRALARAPPGLAEAVAAAMGSAAPPSSAGSGSAPAAVSEWRLGEAVLPGGGVPWWCCIDNFERRASSFLTAPKPPLGDRAAMTALYLMDVRAGAACAPALPPAPPGALRVAQWNLNILAGPDLASPVPAAAAAAALTALGAHVLLLQEAGMQSFPQQPPFNSGLFAGVNQADTNARLRELHGLLEGAGYAIVPTEPPSGCPPCFNPPLLCSRLPVLRAPPAFPLDPPAGPLWDELQARGGEQRAARIVALDAGGGAPLRVVSVHLHHREDGALAGLRRAEVGALLEALAADDAAAPGGAAAATVLAGDFNGARVADLTPPEGQVLEESLRAVKQPLHDGVPELLQGAGFATTYDACAARAGGAFSGAPGFTHWSGAVVDYAYTYGRVEVDAARVLFSPLSDHLPVVTDLRLT